MEIQKIAGKQILDILECLEMYASDKNGPYKDRKTRWTYRHMTGPSSLQSQSGTLLHNSRSRDSETSVLQERLPCADRSTCDRSILVQRGYVLCNSCLSLRNILTRYVKMWLLDSSVMQLYDIWIPVDVSLVVGSFKKRYTHSLQTKKKQPTSSVDRVQTTKCDTRLLWKYERYTQKNDNIKSKRIRSRRMPQ